MTKSNKKRTIHISLCLISVYLCVASARSWSYQGQSFTGNLTETNSDALSGLCDDVPQKAGYFKIDGTKNANYFYWQFDSRSDATTDPVILWMTGGPGCSSGVALFHENGPCKIDSSKASTTPNPYSWNSNASIVFIDQPAGVGFSYGDTEDALRNEAGVAEDMYHFLHEFMKANPTLAKVPLYIFGESYGGHYAPATANRIGASLNLAGLGVGNGLTDPEIQYKYYGQMAYNYSIERLGHATISEQDYESMEAAWPTCHKMIAKCQTDTDSCTSAQSYCNNAMLAPYEESGLNVYDIREPCKVKPLCYDFSDVETFLNSNKVKTALGVPSDLTWSSCNFTVNGMFGNDWMKDFQTKIPDLLANGTKVMIYAGDVDFICNWIGNKAWTLALDWPGKEKFNAATDAPWLTAHNPDKSSAAGKCRSSDGFTFLQIHNAGHMVPLDQPENALEMVNNFMNDKVC